MGHQRTFEEGVIFGLEWVMNTCCKKELSEEGRDQIRQFRTELLKEQLKNVHNDH